MTVSGGWTKWASPLYVSQLMSMTRSPIGSPFASGGVGLDQETVEGALRGRRPQVVALRPGQDAAEGQGEPEVEPASRRLAAGRAAGNRARDPAAARAGR